MLHTTTGNAETNTLDSHNDAEPRRHNWAGEFARVVYGV